MLSNCKDCIHSIYDEVWGECKCKVHGHRIYNQKEYADCGYYRQRESVKRKTAKPRRKR